MAVTVMDTQKKWKLDLPSTYLHKISGDQTRIDWNLNINIHKSLDHDPNPGLRLGFKNTTGEQRRIAGGPGLAPKTLPATFPLTAFGRTADVTKHAPWRLGRHLTIPHLTAVWLLWLLWLLWLIGKSRHLSWYHKQKEMRIWRSEIEVPVLRNRRLVEASLSITLRSWDHLIPPSPCLLQVELNPFFRVA